jgi:hypothetical protein
LIYIDLANAVGSGAAIDETLNVAERGIIGPKIPQITPPPTVIQPFESSVISSQMGYL